MEWFTTVARLGYATDIDNSYLVAILLCLNSFYYILGSRNIHSQHALWLVVGTRRDHTSDMEYIVGTRCRIQNIVVIHQIAPYDADFVAIFCHFLAVALRITHQHRNIELVASSKQLRKTCRAHNSRSSGQKHSFFHRPILYFYFSF